MSAGECHLCGTVWTGDDNTDCAAHCDAVRRLSAQLAKVTAELDALSRTAEPFDVRTAWHLLREAADLSGAPFNEWSDWMGRAAFWRYPPDGYGPEPAFARTTPTEGETE
jgi:hypothetical protein